MPSPGISKKIVMMKTIQRWAKRCGCLLSYSHAESGRELTQPCPAFYPSSVQVNEKGRKVEADVAMCPLLSLFRREENRDGIACVPYALHSY